MIVTISWGNSSGELCFNQEVCISFSDFQETGKLAALQLVNKSPIFFSVPKEDFARLADDNPKLFAIFIRVSAESLAEAKLLGRDSKTIEKQISMTLEPEVPFKFDVGDLVIPVARRVSEVFSEDT